MVKASQTPQLFSAMLGLKTNMSTAEFTTVSSFARRGFAGVATVGLDEIVLYVHVVHAFM